MSSIKQIPKQTPTPVKERGIDSRCGKGQKQRAERGCLLRQWFSR